MSTESVEDALSKRAAKIVTHMNDDHGDSLKAYLQHFKQLDAIKGELTQISVEGMTLKATLANETVVTDVFIPYSSGPLKSAGEIRTVVVAMHKDAYNALGISYKLQNGYYESIAGHVAKAFAKNTTAQVAVAGAVALIGMGLFLRYKRQN
jgi:hypothetical protein